MARPATGLERLFLRMDVRTFAVLSLPSPTPLARVSQSLATVSNHCALPHVAARVSDDSLSLEALPPGEIPLPTTTLTHTAPAVLCDSDIATDSAAFLAEVSTLVRARPATQPPLRLVEHTALLAPDGLAMALVVNINHAAADGRALVAYLQCVLSTLSHDPSSVPPTPVPSLSLLVSLPAQGTPADIRTRLLPAPVDVLPGGRYLPLPGAPLTAAELGLVGSSSASTPVEPSSAAAPMAHASLSEAALTAARRHAGSGITVTGLLVACLQAAAAEQASVLDTAATPRCVAVSVLVDMRPYLQTSKEDSTADDTHQVPTVAVGTVTTAAHLDAALTAASRASSTPADNSSLIALAAAATADLQQRLGRGEAATQAHALAAGDWAGGPLSSPLELSNIGAVQLFRDAHVWLGQRFDAYANGVSILAHTERAIADGDGVISGGILRLCGAPGRGVDSAVVETILNRTLALLQGI